MLPCQAVDEKVAGIMRQTYDLYDLPHFQIREQIRPGSVTSNFIIRHEIIACWECLLQAGQDGGAELRDDQIEGHG